MPSKLESRVSALEKAKPTGRQIYVWKDSEAHREALANPQPGDFITVLRWMESPDELLSP